MNTKVKLKSKNTSKNELIEKRRKKIRLRRFILLFIILVSVVVTLCLKLPYFNIKHIEVLDNRNISSNDIKKLSNINLGENIFYLNLKKSKSNILSNPYIVSANIKRKFPDKISISVSERTAVFYIKRGDKYLVVDKDGVVLEEKSVIKDMKLLKLCGFEKDSYKVGEVINTKNKRKINIISKITELINNLNKGIPEPSIVDVTDVTDIKLFYGNMLVKIGTSEDIQKKFNRAINVLIYNKLIEKKGYIDVSFKGNPVFLIQD